MRLYSGGLIIGRIFASELGAYFREGVFFYILFIYLLFFLGGGRGYYPDFKVFSHETCPF